MLRELRVDDLRFLQGVPTLPHTAHGLEEPPARTREPNLLGDPVPQRIHLLGR